MKKIILIFLINFIYLFGYANDKQVAEIRGIFFALSLDSEHTAKELEAIRKIENPSGIIVAYEAAMEALMAHVEWNPFAKIGHVKSAQKIFDRALQMDPHNVEIHFLRFSVEWHIPKWLGLSKHMQSDKDFIMENLSSFDISCISEDMLDFINTFLSKSGWYSAQELDLVSEVTGK